MANADRICSIPDCGKSVRARGWCRAHHARWLKHGDALGGGTTQGDPLAFLESAIAAETDDCILWPFSVYTGGYGKLWIGGKHRRAHREICERVYGPAPTLKHQAAHDNNGKPCVSRACINPRHLRWATRAENESDKLLHGTHNRGERCGAARVTESQALEIRSLRGTMTQREIGEMFGIAPGTVSAIQRKVSWKWLGDRDEGRAA